MKVGDRKQQGRAGEDTKLKETCPACKIEYLENSYSKKMIDGKRKWIKIGKYCPNKLCTFSRKD